MVGAHIHVTPGDSHLGFLAAVFNRNYPWLEHGHQRCVLRQDAQFTFQPRGGDLINVLGIDQFLLRLQYLV